MTGRGARPAPRLYVTERLLADEPVELGAEIAHRLHHVLRLAPGAAVVLFNGADGAWRARLDAVDKRRCRLTPIAQLAVRPVPAPDGGDALALLFAPLKRQPLDWLVEKATELGVTEFKPVVTARTIAERVRIDRLETIAVQAAEQCERLTVPRVHLPAPLGRVLDGWPADRRIWLCAERGAVRPIAAAARAAPGLGAPGLGAAAAAVLVGPEGGFTDAELDLLKRLPFVEPVGLGPRVLRAETAAIAALACRQALAGDWSPAGREHRPPDRA